MKPKVIDLFAGVGGLSLGFEMHGFDVVLANEYDASIAAAYTANHRNTKMIVGDITSLDLKKTFSVYSGDIAVIIGGPPCQGFSQKGQRKTIHDERNFLFKYYVEVVKLVKPRYFVMENVPNLLTAEGGYFYREIEELFKSIGYSLKSGVLNASDYGVPQNRRRAVIIGKKDGAAPEPPKPKGAPVTIWDAISDLAYLKSGEGTEIQNYRNEPQSDYQKLLRSGSETLYNHVATKHSGLALSLENSLQALANAIAKDKDSIDKMNGFEYEKVSVYQARTLPEFDVFLSHANVDKQNIVDELNNSLEKLGVKIFYDKKSLEWGDKWKERILEGTKKSEFAIIVISKNFFDREWTEKELNEFLNQQNRNGQKFILPIVHNITVDDLKRKYPSISEIQAIDSNDYTCDEIALLFARQFIKRLKGVD